MFSDEIMIKWETHTKNYRGQGRNQNQSFDCRENFENEIGPERNYLRNVTETK